MTMLDELLRTRVARFVDRLPDWDAFADARVEGYRRAQHRYIGAGASGKTDARAIPAEQFTLSVMFVPPGQGNAAHTHEVEEVFFILDGKVKVFFVAGERLLRPAFGMRRIEWPGDPGVEFHLLHGDWIRVLRHNGFEIEDLIEIRPPESATTSYDYVTLEWARQWPGEEIWRARRR